MHCRPDQWRSRCESDSVLQKGGSCQCINVYCRPESRRGKYILSFLTRWQHISQTEEWQWIDSKFEVRDMLWVSEEISNEIKEWRTVREKLLLSALITMLCRCIERAFLLTIFCSVALSWCTGVLGLKWCDDDLKWLKWPRIPSMIRYANIILCLPEKWRYKIKTNTFAC